MAEAISKIKEKLESLAVTDIPDGVTEFKADERKGVVKLVASAEKRYQNHLNELIRLEEISAYEKECYNNGCTYVAGIDEVGRGPLAGPVVTAVVILKQGVIIEGINDSKKLSEAKREKLYDIILEEAVDYAIGIISPTEIDEINILQATYKAMQQCISGLKVKPDYILVDAVTIPNIEIKQKGIIKGDAKSISIGAASIVAKVTRDRMMKEYAQIFPEYDFEQNKGYGSSKHIQAIKQIGLCPIHRRSFVKNFM
ncbi:MAG TPA: ribonuclease HII [Lachnospiraceae bacterium]|nr:ribonuclease HII [Lachnospiraceae bacterium]